jgi:hypothetical protein
MFRPKKTIPKLAVAMLTLTGCGDDGGGGTGGSGGGGMSANLTNALNAWCMKLVPCYLEDYPDYTVQECIDINTEFYGLDTGISAACDAAATSYFQCGSMLMCDMLTARNNDCDPEFYAANDVCN